MTVIAFSEHDGYLMKKYANHGSSLYSHGL